MIYTTKKSPQLIQTLNNQANNKTKRRNLCNAIGIIEDCVRYKPER